jgi:catechol 2,3-dioxygenase-like lactoylglutathione lyase family enzyme
MRGNVSHTLQEVFNPAEFTMARAIDIAYVSYQVTDLDRMEQFLADFGLVRAARTNDALYMRGATSSPFLHVTHRGATNAFAGVAFAVEHRAELEALATLPGSSPIRAIDGPGGGEEVVMTSADGHCVSAVHGRASAAPLAIREPNPFNAGAIKPRLNRPLRPPRAPGLVLRLGHCVLKVRDHDAAVRWFGERLGLVPADYLCVPGNPDHVIGTFLRCDRGANLVDHHSLLVTASDAPDVHHISFEMQDLDAVMGAHDYLVERGYTLDCGVGRHLLGSQIFDYWRDPYGFRIEHYTDGDVVNHQHIPTKFSGTAEETTQWGAKPPLEFFT